MTGLARRTGLSLRLVRTGSRSPSCVIGLLLGGVAGLGTVLYALAIGPLTQLMLPWTSSDRSSVPSADCSSRGRLASGRDQGGGVGGDHHLDGGEPLVGEPLLAERVDPAVGDRRPRPRTA